MAPGAGDRPSRRHRPERCVHRRQRREFRRRRPGSDHAAAQPLQHQRGRPLRGQPGVRALLRRRPSRAPTAPARAATDPAFIHGAALGDLFQYRLRTAANRELIRLDNPLPDPAGHVSTICGIRDAARPDLPDHDRISPSMKVCSGLGNRIENARRDTFRIVGGIKGDSVAAGTTRFRSITAS